MRIPIPYGDNYIARRERSEAGKVEFRLDKTNCILPVGKVTLSQCPGGHPTAAASAV